MNIADRVREISEKEGRNFRNDNDFLKMEEFYKNAIESGFLKKPEYNLPQIDTIGAAFCVPKNPSDNI